MQTKLAAAIFLTLASVDAGAVALNPRGTGQALIYPYYTVRGGQTMALAVVNSTSSGKAAKVRFLEARDGRSMFDLNVYLAPFDVWVGQLISPDADTLSERAALFTTDNSCTVPAVPRSAATALSFFTYAFDGSTGYPITDGGPTDVSRTAEGWIEVIEMGEVTNGSQGSLDAISLVQGVPKSCIQIQNAWADGGYWRTDATVDMATPAGGLYGDGIIVNVDLGTVEGYAAAALSQFYAPGSSPAQTAPGSAAPNLTTGTSTTALVFTGDTTIAMPFATARDAVTAVFMTTRAVGEFWAQPSIGAATEWVLTAPTKPFYTDPQYLQGGNAVAPFDQVYQEPAGVFDQRSAGSCSEYAAMLRGRDDPNDAPGTNFDGGPQIHTYTCNAAQVLGFRSVSAVLQSAVYTLAPSVTLTSGWFEMDYAPAATRSSSNHRLVSTNGNVLYGEPVIGLAVTNFINGALANNVLSNYTMLTPLRTFLDCDRGSATQPCT